MKDIKNNEFKKMFSQTHYKWDIEKLRRSAKAVFDIEQKLKKQEGKCKCH